MWLNSVMHEWVEMTLRRKVVWWSAIKHACTIECEDVNMLACSTQLSIHSTTQHSHTVHTLTKCTHMVAGSDEKSKTQRQREERE